MSRLGGRGEGGEIPDLVAFADFLAAGAFRGPFQATSLNAAMEDMRQLLLTRWYSQLQHTNALSALS